MMNDKLEKTTPLYVINKLKPYLTSTGSIRSLDEVIYFSNNMKDINNDIEKCIYLEIIKATCSNADQAEVLDKFLLSGGWISLNSWLKDFIDEKNISFLRLIMDVFFMIPIKLEYLKLGTTAKLINRVVRIKHDSLIKQARDLLRKWKRFVMNDKDPNGYSTETEEVILSRTPRVVLNSAILNVETKKLPSKKIKVPKKTTKLISIDEIKIHDKPNDEIVKNGKNNFFKAFEKAEMEKKVNPVLNTAYAKVEEEDIQEETIVISPASEVIVDSELKPLAKPKKKSVSWKPEEELIQIRYIEGIEKSQNHVNFHDALKTEFLEEKQISDLIFHHTENLNYWGQLIELDFEITSKYTHGIESKEKALREIINRDHEEMFYTVHNVPENPGFIIEEEEIVQDSGILQITKRSKGFHNERKKDSIFLTRENRPPDSISIYDKESIPNSFSGYKLGGFQGYNAEADIYESNEGFVDIERMDPYQTTLNEAYSSSQCYYKPLPHQHYAFNRGVDMSKNPFHQESRKLLNKTAKISNYRTIPCRMYSKDGNCRFGDKCRFIHEDNGFKDGV